MGLEIRGQVSVYRTTALAASGVIHVGRGVFVGIRGINTLNAAQFIQVHYGSATVPADAAVPEFVVHAPANGPFSFMIEEILDYYVTGLTWSNSSTVPTKTIGAADCWVEAFYLPRRG